MPNESGDVAFASLARSVAPFINEYRSASYLFMALETPEEYHALLGVVTLEDQDHSAITIEQPRKSIAPLHMLYWTKPLKDALQDLPKELDYFSFAIPRTTKPLRLLDAASLLSKDALTSSKAYSFQDSVQFSRECAQGKWYKSSRLFWTGVPGTAIIPDSLAKTIRARLASAGIDGFEQLARKYFHSSQFGLHSNTTFDLYAPIRVGFSSLTYDGTRIQGFLQTGQHFEPDKLSLSYQVFSGNHFDGEPISEGQLHFADSPPEHKGRSVLHGISARTPIGKRVKVLLSYKNEVDLLDSAWVPEQLEAPSMPSPSPHVSTTPLLTRGLVMPQPSSQTDSRKVFVVHGRNEPARKLTFAFLRALHLTPIEWSEAVRLTGEGSPHNDSIVATAMKEASAVVVLLTGDDFAQLNPAFLSDSDQGYERTLTPQARPNVLFEAGMAFNQDSRKVVFVEVGPNRPFTDIAGRNVVRLKNSPEAKKDLAQRLHTIGCAVNMTGTDWLGIDFTPVLDAMAATSTSTPSNRARGFIDSWEELKDVLILHKTSGISAELQTRYSSVRASLQDHFGHYRDAIFTLLVNERDKGWAATVLNNMISCISPRDLATWPHVVQRSVPDELDSFDDIIRAVAR